MCWPLECNSCRNSSTWSLIFSSGSSKSIQISTICPFNLSMSFKTKCVITISAYRRTLLSSSWSNLKMSFVLSFRLLGNLLNRSPREMIIFALTPNSIFESRISNIKSKFSMHIFEETHMNLQSAKIADLSKIHTSGEICIVNLLPPFAFL